MSRVGKQPIPLPANVKFSQQGEVFKVEGPKGSMSEKLGGRIEVKVEGNTLKVLPKAGEATEQQGVARMLLANMVKGVTEGYEKKLLLVGVGYKAQVQKAGKELSLSLGFSHPIAYQMPEGVSAQTPVPTEIIVSGTDKQKVGQVCAEVRAFRPPEPYKGKGVRYAEEVVVLKEAKKK